LKPRHADDSSHEGSRYLGIGSSRKAASLLRIQFCAPSIPSSRNCTKGDRGGRTVIKTSNAICNPLTTGSLNPGSLVPRRIMTHPIPQPRRIPFLGNLASINREAPTNSYMLLYQQYGEIFRLDLVGAFDENLVVLKNL